MSSKEEILARIRQNTGTRYEKPDIAAMKRLAYPDKIEQFRSEEHTSELHHTTVSRMPSSA